MKKIIKSIRQKIYEKRVKLIVTTTLLLVAFITGSLLYAYRYRTVRDVMGLENGIYTLHTYVRYNSHLDKEKREYYSKHAPPNYEYPVSIYDSDFYMLDSESGDFILETLPIIRIKPGSKEPPPLVSGFTIQIWENPDDVYGENATNIYITFLNPRDVTIHLDRGSEDDIQDLQYEIHPSDAYLFFEMLSLIPAVDPYWLERVERGDEREVAQTPS